MYMYIKNYKDVLLWAAGFSYDFANLGQAS